MGVPLKLLSPPTTQLCRAQMGRHLVRKRKPVFLRAGSAPAAPRLSAPPYFFFALTFLQTQFMPSFEGNGQKRAVLVASVPRAQPAGDWDTHSRELAASGSTWLTRVGDLWGRQREVPEHRRETDPVNI